MATTSTQRMVITGHRVDSPTRVVHNLRPTGPTNGAALELHVADLVTDDQNILADYTEVDLTVSYSLVPAAQPAA